MSKNKGTLKNSNGMMEKKESVYACVGVCILWRYSTSDIFHVLGKILHRADDQFRFFSRPGY